MTRAKYRKRLGTPEPRFVWRPSGGAAALAWTGTLLLGGFVLGPWANSPSLRLFVGLLAAQSLVIAIGVSSGVLRRRAMLVEAQRRWRDKRGVLVLSNSPRWRDHIARRWLPRIGDRLVLLDHSKRESWGESLEVRLWREYCEGRPDFVPAVILLRGTRPPQIFGFYRWFDAASRGYPEGLAALEERLFRELEKCAS